jgi:anti-anti-sigma factor
MPFFLERIRIETAPFVILDFSLVNYLGSAGVGAVAKIHSSFQLEKRRLAVVGLTQAVRRPLEITNVLRLLTVFDTSTEADDNLVPEPEA